jgi:hypothetical protein
MLIVFVLIVCIPSVIILNVCIQSVILPNVMACMGERALI